MSPNQDLHCNSWRWQILIFVKESKNVKYVTELAVIIKISKFGGTEMSTQQQARALMMRHYQIIRNRQQSMLGRAAAAIGLDVEENVYNGVIQGKLHPTFRKTYDRSSVSLS